jgi:pimeloyl-ACP methyl ester carboxylesterase
MTRLGATISSLLLLGILWLSPAAYAQSAKGGEAGPGSFAPVAGSKIYYEECNRTSGQTVVLLHDGVLDSAAWNDAWPEFCKHFRTIRYDRRGYGRSPAATEGFYESDDLAALLRHLKVTRAAVVGSSHGGEISINFALDHPEVVQQLVLVGAVVGGMPYSAHFLERGNVLGKPLEKGDVPGAIAAAAKDKYLIAPGHDAARKRMADLLTARPQDLTHPYFEISPKPALPRLQEIRVPTLLLVGEADIPDVHAHAGAIEAGIPRARRVVVNDVGHLMYLEKPAEFSTLVIEFIERND